MKSTEQYFPVVLFIMVYKVVLTCKSVWNSKVLPFKWELLRNLSFIFSPSFSVHRNVSSLHSSLINFCNIFITETWNIILTGNEKMRFHVKFEYRWTSLIRIKIWIIGWQGKLNKRNVWFLFLFLFLFQKSLISFKLFLFLIMTIITLLLLLLLL